MQKLPKYPVNNNFDLKPIIKIYVSSLVMLKNLTTKSQLLFSNLLKFASIFSTISYIVVGSMQKLTWHIMLYTCQKAIATYSLTKNDTDCIIPSFCKKTIALYSHNR